MRDLSFTVLLLVDSDSDIDLSVAKIYEEVYSQFIMDWWRKKNVSTFPETIYNVPLYTLSILH